MPKIEEKAEDTLKTASTTIHVPKPFKGDEKKATILGQAEVQDKIQKSRLTPTNLNPYPPVEKKSPFKK